MEDCSEVSVSTDLGNEDMKRDTVTEEEESVQVRGRKNFLYMKIIHCSDFSGVFGASESSW